MSTEATQASAITVGIIGDGQLGMLLCQAAPALGLRTVMLTSDHSCPAARCADESVEGAMDDPGAIAELIERSDIITYEREDVPAKAIAQLRDAQDNERVACYPPLRVIELIQDKARQKTWLESNGLATLPFVIVDGSDGKLREAVDMLEFPLVQKALRGGFDGRGVQVLRSVDDLEKAWPGTTLMEKYAGDFRELAVLVVRARNGDSTHFGPVDMTFESDYSVLDTVSAPADIKTSVASRATALAHRAIEAMDGVGVFGVEMFLLESGEVLINEISPRVHNAGHYTIEACASSQFEQHLRAVTGLPLADTDLSSPAAMRNILCTPALKREGVHREAVSDTEDDTTVYWYGKSPARLMRKLGHITALRKTPIDALNAVTTRWQAIQEGASS